MEREESNNKTVEQLKPGELWQQFCQRLGEAGASLTLPEAPSGTFDQAEGTRYLSRLVRLGLDIYLESGDPAFPVFYKPSHETAKMGGDNPDNLYLSATISGAYSYMIRGNIGAVPYISWGTRANRYAIDGTMRSTGEITTKELKTDEYGNFSIVVSREPQNTEANWLPLEDDSNMLHARVAFLDRRTEIMPTMEIERIGAGPDVPEPADPQLLADRLMQAADFVVNTPKLFTGWAKKFMTRPNELLDWGQDMFIKAGGDPSMFYVHGYWQLGSDEALVIETTVPECEHWNIQVNNWWMESLDYRYHTIHVNKKTARLNPDGTATIVIAHSDPGFGNWLRTDGHDCGFALLRWVNAKSTPVPTSSVITL